MDNYYMIMKSLVEYTEEEIFYKGYDKAKKSGSKETLDAFLAQYDPKFIIDRKLLCPEVYNPGVSMIDEHFYIPMNSEHNVWLEKHNRYAPAFMHSHEYFEAFYVLSGQCTHCIDGKASVLKQGSFCLIAPYKVHSMSVFDDSVVINFLIQRTTFDDIFFNLLRHKNVLSRFFFSSLYMPSGMSHILFHLEDDEEMEKMILSMLMEELTADEYTNRILNNMLGIFFTMIIRKYGKTAEIHEDQQPKTTETVLDMISYMNENYTTVTLKSVADEFGYTEEHCSRLIKKESGKTFTSLLRFIRMRRAETLLANTGLSNSEISYRLGYENAGTFIKLFKQFSGMTPGEFRDSAGKSL